MNFSCDKCQRRYSIADEKVRGKTVKVRCKNCQNVISVQGPPAEMEESTRVVSLADVARIREQELAAAAAAAPAPAAAAPASPWEDEPTRAAPGRAMGAPWFVMVKSKQEGPLDEPGLRALMESGAINPRSFFWQQGMADWKRGADIPEVAAIFESPAPEPEPPPQAPSIEQEPATVAARGPRSGSSRGQQVQEPAPEDDGAWDNVPTTVGRAAPARESWDLDPQAAAPAQQRQGGRAQAQQSKPSWDLDEPQQDQPAWDAPAQDEQPQDQAAWDGQEPQQEEPAQDEPQDQPAWDEPEQPQQQAGRAAGNKAGVGDDLFSDLDLPDRNEQVDEPEPLTAANEPDPLASVRGSKPGREDKKAAEDTQYFMKKSGVTKRNPAWKVALFVLVPLLLVVSGVFALDSLNVVPKVKVVNAQGQTVERSMFFSGEGRTELRDRLLGTKKPVPTPAPVAPAPAPAPGDKKPAPKPDTGGSEETKAVPDTGKSAEELKALYGDGSKTDTAPTVRKDTEVAATAGGQGGPPAEDIMKVVEKSQGAIQGCVETELRKNPSFKGGKVLLVATVGTSGTVTKATLDRKELDTSPVGDCIKKSAKRMVFPAFKLEDGTGEVDLEIPLVLSSGSL